MNAETFKDGTPKSPRRRLYADKPMEPFRHQRARLRKEAAKLQTFEASLRHAASAAKHGSTKQKRLLRFISAVFGN